MAIIQDDRTAVEVEQTLGFVVATDTFLSGWGDAKNGRSIVACPIVSDQDLHKVEEVFDRRPEFLRVRFVEGQTYRPKLGTHDHLHIYNTRTSFRSVTEEDQVFWDTVTNNPKLTAVLNAERSR
jgi:hypothetical protein